MKINVLVDPAGRVLATHYRSPMSLNRSSSGPSVSEIRPAPGQSLHTIDLPTELESHIINRTFAQEVRHWKLHQDTHGKKLTRSP